MIEAKVICDSVSPDDVRLTTMEVKLHRFVLAELNTHRMFSRNSASSRAIPVTKTLYRVRKNTAVPVYWGKNKPGMSATEEIEDIDSAQRVWQEAMNNAHDSARKLLDLGVHKQIVNRLVEPFMWHTVIITATDWANFFGQRLAVDTETGLPYAQPEMFDAALAMHKAYLAHQPCWVPYGEWHLPYIEDVDRDWAWDNTDTASTEINSLKKISVGRCARVSYLTHDGKRDPQEDINLANKLIQANPMHASPFEHVATPARSREIVKGNLKGWHQYRHDFPNEQSQLYL